MLCSYITIQCKVHTYIHGIVVIVLDANYYVGVCRFFFQYVYTCQKRDDVTVLYPCIDAAMNYEFKVPPQI